MERLMRPQAGRGQNPSPGARGPSPGVPSSRGSRENRGAIQIPQRTPCQLVAPGRGSSNGLLSRPAAPPREAPVLAVVPVGMVSAGRDRRLLFGGPRADVDQIGSASMAPLVGAAQTGRASSSTGRTSSSTTTLRLRQSRAMGSVPRSVPRGTGVALFLTAWSQHRTRVLLRVRSEAARRTVRVPHHGERSLCRARRICAGTGGALIPQRRPEARVGCALGQPSPGAHQVARRRAGVAAAPALGAASRKPRERY
jgi:hypothetical protein